MAKPKLALVPSAQGSKFYSVLPSSGVGDFTFSRSGSATRINSQGLIETVGNGVSRLNYPLIDGKVVGCPHHILEPQRTNLVTYSEDFSQWSLAGGSSISSNQSISPDGTLNADNVSSGEVYVSGVGSSGNTYTFSCYYKGNAGETFVQNVYDGSNHNRFTRTFNGQWQRFSITVTLTNSGIFYLVDDRTGGNSSSFSVWGAQLEQGSFTTSYILTNGSSVTRSAETATGSGDASTFNDSEGVLMAEISALANSDTTNPNRGLGISSGSTNNTIFIYYQGTLNKLSCIIVSDGIVQFSSSTTLFNVDYYLKIGLKYKQNDFALWVNGVEALTDTSGNTPVGLNELAFDNGAGLDNFYGNTKQVQYYDSALTDSELETLTSWVSFSDMANGQLYTIQ